MKATESNIVNFLKQQDIKFIIPVYQRNYEWKMQQCKQLIEDIYRVGVDEDIKSHFIGSIVFIHDDIYTTGLKELTIIDGQQRLTTITLIFIALYHKYKEANNEKLANEIYKKYLINEFAEEEEEEKLKLKPTKENDRAIKSLIRGDFKETYKEYSRLIENYEYFKNYINDEDIEVVRTGLMKLLYVEISLERGKDDPQKIFQSLNSTGLDLTPADLIRNYILMDLKHREQKKIYENYWLHIEDFTIDKDNGFSKLSDFIRDFLTLKFREIPNKSKVFEAFKTKYPLESKQDLENILKEVKSYAEIYSKLIKPEYEKDENIRKHLEYINRLEMSVSYPFLLEVYNDYNTKIINKDTFIAVLKLVQNFVFRRFIVGVATNALNKVFMKLYEDIKKDNYLESLQISLIKKKGSQRFPRDYELIEELRVKDMYNVKSKSKNYYLELLENYNNNEIVEIENNDKISIEHIFPQNPDAKWKMSLGEEEFGKMKEKVNTIANLSLSGFNSNLGNKYFTEKRDMENKGYKHSRLFLNRFLAQCDKWTSEELNKRFDIIKDKTLEIWAFPEVSVNIDTREEAELNIFEIEDPTNKTIDYVIFFDQRINSIKFKDLYEKVCSFIFETEPNIFLNTELREKLGVTQDYKALRKPMKISPLYFVEGNLSSKDIFERIKLTMSKVDIQDEIYVKFKD